MHIHLTGLERMKQWTSLQDHYWRKSHSGALRVVMWGFLIGAFYGDFRRRFVSSVPLLR